MYIIEKLYGGIWTINFDNDNFYIFIKYELISRDKKEEDKIKLINI